MCFSSFPGESHFFLWLYKGDFKTMKTPRWIHVFSRWSSRFSLPFFPLVFPCRTMRRSCNVARRSLPKPRPMPPAWPAVWRLRKDEKSGCWWDFKICLIGAWLWCQWCWFDLSLSGTSVGLFNLGLNGDFDWILSIKSWVFMVFSNQNEYLKQWIADLGVSEDGVHRQNGNVAGKMTVNICYISQPNWSGWLFHRLV